MGKISEYVSKYGVLWAIEVMVDEKKTEREIKKIDEMTRKKLMELDSSQSIKREKEKYKEKHSR